jgi:membrane-associated phospholipid phosphatase
MKKLLQFINKVARLVNTILDTFFITVTELGSELFYMIFLPPIFWCLNKKFGFRLFFITLLAGYFTALVKNITSSPRPPEKHWMVEPESSSFPSGHAMGPTSMWGYIIVKLKHQIILIIGISIIILVSISRLYLGVHYPIDILGGLVFGIGLVIGFIYFEPALSEQINNLNFSQKIILSLIIPLILAGLAYLTLPGDIRAISGSGALLGICLGYVVESRINNFVVKGNLFQKIYRVIIGFLVTFIIFFGIYSLIPKTEFWYFILALTGGICITLIAPIVFTNLEHSAITK